MTNAFKTSYDSLPETISIPDEYVNKRAEVIILFENETPATTQFIGEFFGSIPDFPDRAEQGTIETRDTL
ncbi:MAG: hypothetical protein WD492_08295 [Alkalispirochaeta sp.]